MTNTCPFCNPSSERVWREHTAGLVLWDGYPVAKGHTLVVPRPHVASLFELPANDRQALWDLVTEARQQLSQELNPDGFNIGVNDGAAAGQTVLHAHIHIIPRWDGDVPDPRGGVRWVIPDKADYWSNR